MYVLRFTFFITLVLLLFVFITQIATPLVKGRPIFPWLRKQHDLEEELAELNQEEYETELEKEIRLRREALEKESQSQNSAPEVKQQNEGEKTDVNISTSK